MEKQVQSKFFFFFGGGGLRGDPVIVLSFDPVFVFLVFSDECFNGKKVITIHNLPLFLKQEIYIALTFSHFNCYSFSSILLDYSNYKTALQFLLLIRTVLCVSYLSAKVKAIIRNKNLLVWSRIRKAKNPVKLDSLILIFYLYIRWFCNLRYDLVLGY